MRSHRSYCVAANASTALLLSLFTATAIALLAERVERGASVRAERWRTDALLHGRPEPPGHCERKGFVSHVQDLRARSETEADQHKLDVVQGLGLAVVRMYDETRVFDLPWSDEPVELFVKLKNCDENSASSWMPTSATSRPPKRLLS